MGVWNASARTEPAKADVLEFGVFIEPMARPFAAKARLLDSTEGHDLAGNQAGVDADHPRLDGLGHAEAPRDVLRIELAGQPELGGIGQVDGLLLGVEAHQGRDRAKCLFPHALHLCRHVQQHRGL